MLFDENNVCVGIKQPFIHCYNKGGAMLPKDDPYFHEYAIRQNVVMFGDSLGDLTMHHGVERTGALLTVALCNYGDKPELVEKYEKLYDIVVVGDESFDVPIQIVEKVLKG
ncbi:hypothetical protein L596_025924 [Steinernema carpocapsae]|uniref:5'-nucleotidase n=1 Tax=Steinernema carpocapsae TaxID=34508 RepID=A0A4U5MAT9_STECR|nr:hypothetical protein L596_025924 [Steinernema carpocapsae]